MTALASLIKSSSSLWLLPSKHPHSTKLLHVVALSCTPSLAVPPKTLAQSSRLFTPLCEPTPSLDGRASSPLAAMSSTSTEWLKMRATDCASGSWTLSMMAMICKCDSAGRTPTTLVCIVCYSWSGMWANVFYQLSGITGACSTLLHTITQAWASALATELLV